MMPVVKKMETMCSSYDKMEDKEGTIWIVNTIYKGLEAKVMHHFTSPFEEIKKSIYF